VTSDGVTIDGRLILYTDPQATAELERIVNRPPPTPSRGPTSAARSGAPGSPPSQDGAAASFADNVRVTRDGFEFHVVYRTRFGQNKTEKLDAALEAFQTMRAFKPHVNMQKSGIRLVVTRWDGESFVEQPGIENVEHAEPEQIEALIKSNLLGGPAAATGIGSPRRANVQRQVIRVEVVKKPRDARFHLVFHRLDGSTEDGPMLIRPNLVKLAGEGLFRPDVSVSMTAVNDRVIITRKTQVEGQSGVQSETFPLNTDKEGKKVEDALNECLKPIAEPAAADLIPEQVPAPAPEPQPVLSAAPPVPLLAPATPQQISPAPTPETSLAAKTPAVEVQPVQSAVPTPPPTPEKPKAPLWLVRSLKQVESLGMEEINSEVFSGLQRRFERPVHTNERDFPGFTLDVRGKEGSPIQIEFVLTSHYLLCTFPFGYLRFGAETRIFLDRLDDYIAFPHHALRGIMERRPAGEFAFLVSRDFAEFLRTHSDRNYKAHFGDFLISAEDAKADAVVLWPLSTEARLFEAVVATATGYGLPTTHDTVVLVPNAPRFIGFNRTPPNGMEFCDGEDYVRFAPDDIEFREQGQSVRFETHDVLLGWALDTEGRVCTLYRKTSGFAPPPDAKLLRFLAEDEAEAERANLTILARLRETA
jgi:hypothetical protein